MTTEFTDARRRFDRDVAWSALAMLVPIAVGLVALPLIARNVHQQAFTLFLLSYGAISFAPSLDLGIARTSQRRIAFARYLSPAQVTLVRHSLRRAFATAIAATAIMTVAATILLPAQASMSARLGLGVTTGAGVGMALYANCQRSVLEGLGAFARSALNRAGVGVMFIATPAILSFFVHDPTLLSLSTSVVRLPFIWEQQRVIRATTAGVPVGHTVPDDNLLSGFMRESGWFALLSILAVAMSGFDRYILIGWGGLAGLALSIFLPTQDLALRAIAIPSALIPALAVRLAANDAGELGRSLARRLFLVIVPGVLLGCVGGAIISGDLVHLLYPRLPVRAAASTLRVLFMGIAASAVAQFPMTRLLATGRARDAALMHSGELILYLSLAPLIVSRFGATGGAALWSGRIVVDTAALILWSAANGRERRFAAIEAIILACSVLTILLVDFLV